jgi:hypothetical protein
MNIRTVKETLGKKFGNDKIKNVMNKVTDAYRNGIRGEALTILLKDVMIKEGLSGGVSSIDSKYILKPPIIYPHSL